MPASPAADRATQGQGAEPSARPEGGSEQWHYVDRRNEEFGPYDTATMLSWFQEGFFGSLGPKLRVRLAQWERHVPVGDLYPPDSIFVGPPRAGSQPPAAAPPESPRDPGRSNAVRHGSARQPDDVGTRPAGAPPAKADVARRRGRAGRDHQRREHVPAPGTGDAGQRGRARAGPVAPGSVSPTVERAAELLNVGPQSLLARVEKARASGLSRAFDGRWKCPTGEVVTILGDHVVDHAGRLDWSLRAYWPGVATRRVRATIEGREFSGRLKFDGSEITWSDGDVWHKVMPPGHEPARPPDNSARNLCIVAAYERSLGQADDTTGGRSQGSSGAAGREAAGDGPTRAGRGGSPRDSRGAAGPSGGHRP